MSPVEATVTRVQAKHRLTFWSVYHWKDGGWSGAPRCTCGVLWSAGNADDPTAQIAMHEAHVAAEVAAALRADEGLVEAMAEALDHHGTIASLGLPVDEFDCCARAALDAITGGER